MAPLLAVMLAALMPTKAPAFKPEVHEDLTERSLRDVRLKTPSGTGAPAWEFSPTARAQIAKANKDVDGVNFLHGGTIFGLFPDTADEHFDDSLKDGAARLYQRRVDILSKLRQADSIGRSIGATSEFDSLIKGARTELGRALHAVQDFYSHTSWVDSGNTRPVPGLGERPDGFTDVEGACRCGAPQTTTMRSAPLVTGWFRAIPNATAEDPETGLIVYAPGSMIHDATVGRCIHGSAFPQPPVSDALHMISRSDCPLESQPDYPVISGITKDDPDHNLFPQAAAQAKIASAGFAAGILKELDDGGYFVALCAFLGYEDSRNCYRKVEHVTAVELTYARFAIDAFKTEEEFSLELPLFDPSLGTLRSVTTKWKITLDGVATCPNEPSAVDFRATFCVLWRRIANLQLSSPDIQHVVNHLYCETVPGTINATRCPGFLADDTSAQLYRWPGNSERLFEEFTRSYRILTDAPELLIKPGGPTTFRVDGQILTRFLAYLGFGSGLDPFVLPGTGQFFSLEDTVLRIEVAIAFEYETAPNVVVGGLR